MPRSFVRAPEPLVVATANPGKLREIGDLLEGLPFAPLSMRELGIAAPAETGATFRDNALLKARHASRAASMAAIADDSGLEVDALDGAPGIRSARYANEAAPGGAATDAENTAKLLRSLRARPGRSPSARYRCALAFVGRDAASAPLVAEAAWEGEIIDTPRGTGGFGYDAVFWLPELGLTAAELSAAQKNRLSHRARAMRALRDLLAAAYAR